jgi:DNA transformation protein
VGPDDIRELFSAFGPVTVRRMFSGAGVFVAGTMIAIAHDGAIYLKADAQSAAAFDREGLGPFTYRRNGRPAALASYRRIPDRLYDDPEELAEWARVALAAAERSRSREPAARQRRTRQGPAAAARPARAGRKRR